MSINEYKQLQAQAASIGIYTACDLSKFYEYEKRAGETLPETVARYENAIKTAAKCARQRGCESCEMCCYSFICDTYAEILSE